MKTLNVQLLMTGNELMTGDIVDSNSAMIAQQLMSLGLTITRKVTIADELDLLVNEIATISKQADILIINGGLGPTTDDLTSQALALATKQALVEHPDATTHLIQWCLKKGITLEATNLKQAILPSNAKVIDNPIGSAVGFSVNFHGCNIYCTPGVPKELAMMLEQQLLPLIQIQVPTTQFYLVKRYQIFGIGESSLQKMINDAFPDWPRAITLGYRAASPMLELKLIIKHQHDESLLEHWQRKLFTLLGDHLIGPFADYMPSMAEHVLIALNKHQQQITTAESCTGGMIASMITNISGASSAFEAGFVTYSNQMKTAMIDVSDETLAKNGAVSEAVVIEMAHGALAKSGADYAIAVSGIAGPDGGTPDKPVGSVWIAWGHKDNIKTHYFCIKGSREYFQTMVATRALDLIRRELINSKQQAFYLNR